MVLSCALGDPEGSSLASSPLCLWSTRILGLVWLVSLARAVYKGGLLPMTRFTRWVVIAGLVVAVVLAGWSGAFLRLGFQFSLASLEAAASSPDSSGFTISGGFAGIYPIDYVSTTPHGSTVWLSSPAGLLDDVGFHRSTLGNDGGDCEEAGWAYQLDSHWYAVSCSW